jgi:RNA polymerase sigma-70 factor, ECF subfamily
MAVVHEATLALMDLGRGDRGAVDRLLPLVYDELRKLAAGRAQMKRPGQSIEPTALVHEVFLRLIEQTGAAYENRAHFFAVAATAMHQILTDRARRRRAEKRGGGRARVELHEDVARFDDTDWDLVALDDALERLNKIDPRLFKVVEMRFFAGMTVDEIAQVLQVSKSTVETDWRVARAFLNRELKREA